MSLLDFNKLPKNIKLSSSEDFEAEVEVDSAVIDGELAEIEVNVGSIELSSEEKSTNKFIVFQNSSNQCVEENHFLKSIMAFNENLLYNIFCAIITN